MSPPPLPEPTQVGKILVRSTNWIGDVVLISPALAALRRRYPAARIEVVAVPQVAAALQGNPAVDEVILFDRRGADRGAAGLLRAAGRLRRRGYDMAVLFQKAVGAALMARLAGVPVRIGLASDRRGALLTHAVPLTPDLARRHHLEIFLEVARAAGCDASDRTLFFPVSGEARAWAAAFLEERGASRFPLLAALHVGASKRPRAWHAERFAEAARRIGEAHGAGFVLLGGKGDAADLAPAASVLGERALDASGLTTLPRMAALIERCRLLVGNDSGPMHVAAALGVPVVAVFGPGDPGRTAPYVPAGAGRVEVVSRHYPCAPCRQAFFSECYPSPAGKPMCLESVTVEEVVAAAGRILGGA